MGAFRHSGREIDIMTSQLRLSLKCEGQGNHRRIKEDMAGSPGSCLGARFPVETVVI